MSVEPGGEYPPGDGPGGDEISSDDRTWGVIAHAAALAGFVVPLGNVLGPLVVWAIKKDESRFVAENGRDALNFQITWTGLSVVVFLASLIVVGDLFALPVLGLLGLVWLLIVVVAIIRVSDGEVYEYPVAFDLIP